MTTNRTKLLRDNAQPLAIKAVAEHVADFFLDIGVRTCFQVSGGMIAFLADAIDRAPGLALLNLKTEQAAGFAAEGLARFSGRPTVVLATSGPGATNLITPIASCYFDSTPVLFVTGQVHSSEIKKSPAQRQNGFQELEIATLVRPIVKFSAQVLSPEGVVPALRTAWDRAREGRPGPVLVDIPIDVQQAMISQEMGAEVDKKQDSLIPEASFEVLAEMTKASRRPLVLAGGGLRLGDAAEEFRDFISRTGIPFVWSLLAKDVLPTEHKLNLGMIGTYGSRCANRAMARSDLLIVLGSRLDVRQTGASVEDFCRDKKIFRVDIDTAELSGRVRADVNVQMNIATFLKRAGTELPSVTFSSVLPREARDCNQHNPVEGEQPLRAPMPPHAIMASIAEIERESAAFVVDVGQHQMWAAQYLIIRDGQRFLTSGGLGSMGFSIPAAVGVATGTSDRVVVIVGDGGAQMSLQEFETIRLLGLNITIYILNNNQHGMVAQFQEENLESNFVGTRDGYSAPQFEKVATAYGIRAIKITSERELQAFQKRQRADQQLGPQVVEIIVNPGFVAAPKLGRDLSLHQM